MALRRQQYVTVEEYFELDERDPDRRYEYIDGHIRMLPRGTPEHTKIAENFVGAISNRLHNDCSIYTSDVSVRLSKTRYVHPDAVVSCDERDRRQEKAISHPLLVVEVLSSDTYYYDRHDKFLQYQACSDVQECVLVSSQYLWIEVFRRKEAKVWFYNAYINPDDEVALTSLNIHFPIKSIYRGVDIAPMPELTED